MRDLNFRACDGELVAVVGSVGAGKTLLISALLGELEMASGEAELSGAVALCTQQAWLTSGTVRENIVFNRAFEADRYNRAVHACCLQPDFEQLPASDQTMVGERGITLSGGQKARIALCRALYRDADVYL